MSREKILCGKEEIHRCAINIVDRDGIAALSVRSIAKELGVSPMTIYNYVDNFDAIKKRVLINGFDRLYASVFSALNQLSPPVDKQLYCRTIAINIFRFAADNRDLYSYMFSEGQRLFGQDAEVRPFYSFITKIMKRAKATQKDWAANEKGYRLLEMLIFSVSYQCSAGGQSLSEKEYGELIDYFIEKSIS